MLLNKETVKEVIAMLIKFVEQEGDKTIQEFIEGWNKNNDNKIERI